jgi:hypothetical protein
VSDLGNVNIFSQLQYSRCIQGIKMEKEYTGSAILDHFQWTKLTEIFDG